MQTTDGSAPRKRAFHVLPLMSPEFARLFLAAPDTALDRVAPEAAWSPVAEQAHAYQVSASRDELPARWHVTSGLLARLPRLLVVSSNGAGYDTIDVDACTAAGVLAVNQAGGNREAVAEHVLGFMLALTKRIGEADRRMRRAPGIARLEFKGHDLLGRTVGLIGLGNVGSRVAEICAGAFRMRVLAYDPYLSAAEIAARGGTPAPLDDLLREADYVSVSCPLTAQTRGMLGAREFALMRHGAYYINTSRGFIHDEAALAAALAEGRLAGAGLDVWDREPPDPGHPLLALATVLATPHTAGVTEESRDNIARFAAGQLLAILGGERPARLLNPEVWPRYRDRFREVMGQEPASA